MISSIALARGGYYDGALAGAIGSQVINISIGVGLPALFINLTSGLPLQVTSHEARRYVVVVISLLANVWC